MRKDVMFGDMKLGVGLFCNMDIFIVFLYVLKLFVFRVIVELIGLLFLKYFFFIMINNFVKKIK